MHPDRPSVEKDESQLAAASTALSSVPEVGSVRAAEVVAPAVPITEKKRSKLKLPLIALGVFVFIFLAAFAWVGYWTYVLSTNLATAQQQLSVLQAEHEKLKTDYANLAGENEKLNADLTQTRTDLEKANTDLSIAQASLKTVQDQNKNLDAKLKKTGNLVEVLYVFFNLDESTSYFTVASKIDEADDTQLETLWDKFTAGPSEDRFGEILIYVVDAIRDSVE